MATDDDNCHIATGNDNNDKCTGHWTMMTMTMTTNDDNMMTPTVGDGH